MISKVYKWFQRFLHDFKGLRMISKVYEWLQQFNALKDSPKFFFLFRFASMLRFCRQKFRAYFCLYSFYVVSQVCWHSFFYALNQLWNVTKSWTRCSQQWRALATRSTRLSFEPVNAKQCSASLSQTQTRFWILIPAAQRLPTLRLTQLEFERRTNYYGETAAVTKNESYLLGIKRFKWGIVTTGILDLGLQSFAQV